MILDRQVPTRAIPVTLRVVARDRRSLLEAEVLREANAPPVPTTASARNRRDRGSHTIPAAQKSINTYAWRRTRTVKGANPLVGGDFDQPHPGYDLVAQLLVAWCRAAKAIAASDVSALAPQPPSIVLRLTPGLTD